MEEVTTFQGFGDLTIPKSIVNLQSSVDRWRKCRI